MAKYQNPAHVVLDPDSNYTAKASGAIKGGQFVSFVAGGTPGQPTAKQADASSVVVGVAKYDAADGETFGILKGGHVAVIAGAALVAGNGVVSDAAGKAVPAGAGVAPVGSTYTDGAADDAVYIQF